MAPGGLDCGSPGVVCESTGNGVARHSRRPIIELRIKPEVRNVIDDFLVDLDGRDRLGVGHATSIPEDDT